MSRKIYKGKRLPNNTCLVTVNGKKPLYHISMHSPTGFEWGYGGSGPADLALSILADFLGENPTPNQLYTGNCKCWRLHQKFKQEFIAGLPNDTWVILGSEISGWLKERY